MERWKTQNNQSIFERNKLENSHFLDFIVIETVCHHGNNRLNDQLNKTERPEIDLYLTQSIDFWQWL